MQRAIERIMGHAMKHMKVWQKLGFLGVILLVPLTIFMFKTVAAMRTTGVELARQELLGVEYLSSLQNLLEDVQQHRELMTALLNGEASFAEQLTARQMAIQDDLKRVDAIDGKMGATLLSTNHWSSLRKRVAHLIEGTTKEKTRESLDQHTSTIKEMLTFMAFVGESSKLELDPDLLSASLIDLFVQKLPHLNETLSQARGAAIGIAARKVKTEEERTKLSRFAALIEVRGQEARQGLEKTLAYDNQLRSSLGPVGAELVTGDNNAIAAFIHQLTNAATTPASVSDYFNATTNPLTPSIALTRQTGTLLTQTLRARERNRAWEMYAMISWIFVGLIFTLLIGVFVVRDITEPMRRVVRVAEQIAQGDLSVSVSTDDRSDEFGALLSSFQRMTKSLQDMSLAAERIARGDLSVTIQPQSAKDTMGNVLARLVQSLRDMTEQILTGTELLSATTNEILAATTQVAAGATQTASAVTETAATVEQVKQTSLIASQKAKNVSDNAQVTAQVSQVGEQSVSEAISRMERIREQMESIADSVIKLGEQSRAIGEIITSVNDLADQSNLLSVNAAIEAANAGEHGKGFTVVAQEVKSLAEQSKQATAQVRTILRDIQKAANVAIMVTEQGTKAVEAGVAQSLEAGGSIRKLAKNMADAAQSVAQIAVSSQQQVVGMDQVVIAIESIKEASNQNVISVNQVEKSMHRLLDLGQQLQQFVGRYKLQNAAAEA
jgi:methyl-accepting chemotaxis protein